MAPFCIERSMKTFNGFSLFLHSSYAVYSAFLFSKQSLCDIGSIFFTGFECFCLEQSCGDKLYRKPFRNTFCQVFIFLKILKNRNLGRFFGTHAWYLQRKYIHKQSGSILTSYHQDRCQEIKFFVGSIFIGFHLPKQFAS